MQQKLQEKQDLELVIPILPLRDMVVYPHMVIPLFVGRKKSIRALEVAMANDKEILLVAQKSAAKDEPKVSDLYKVGCIASILQLLKLPDGTVKVLVEGSQRAKITKFIAAAGYQQTKYELIEEASPSKEADADILMRSVLSEFELYVKHNSKIPAEILTSVAGIDDVSRLADTIAAHMTLKVEEKQKILEIKTVTKRLECLIGLLESEVDILQIEKKIRNRVKSQMEKSQREYYLNEQIKAIRKELGSLDGEESEFDALKRRIGEAGMSKDAENKANSELKKLEMMPPMSAEATVIRNYLDILLDVPWKKRSKLHLDLNNAEKILNTDHYSLEKVKERILEHLAVQKRVKNLRGPVLCFVGPPGVGKTSLGQSIARATGREFIRMSLGGVRDEAEIRGHRRTYIGSLPGKIIQKISKTSVKNPLFLLDEVDKMAMDFRGDPAAALLEVLDPEQNNTFNDHYLEVDYDLSEVMFIATANTLDIPAPLLDRMELIRIPGYTEDEKVHIAMQHLIPKQKKLNGVKAKELTIAKGAVIELIRYYTREAGVRNLEREISALCRKVIKNIVSKTQSKVAQITQRSVEKYLGVKRYRYGLAGEENRIGQVTGLAWTEVGGELLEIEVSVVAGKGKTMFTGSLGDVMQESIQAATTVVRSRAKSLGIAEDFFEKHDIHVHVPAGATPKDGPSAGIGMCSALVSAITKIPVRAEVAMTGEITLRGEVLPIGGLKEKLLAALRGGIKVVMIPEENSKELKEIPKNIMQSLDLKAVRWIDEVFAEALTEVPKPKIKKDKNDVRLTGRAASRKKNDDDAIHAH